MPPTDARKQVPFSDFYDVAQRRIGVDPVPLVGEWNAAIRHAIINNLSAALKAATFIGTEIESLATLPNGKERSNQSKGNVAANELGNAINYGSNQVSIALMKGAGYPDRVLVLTDPAFKCCFEIKTTSDWNDGDGNRRVLTSSLSKLRKAITSGEVLYPPCHLLGTVLYDRASSIVRDVRLDFLEPDSLVNMRLEASTSHALLAKGIHQSVLLGTL